MPFSSISHLRLSCCQVEGEMSFKTECMWKCQSLTGVLQVCIRRLISNKRQARETLRHSATLHDNGSLTLCHNLKDKQRFGSSEKTSVLSRSKLKVTFMDIIYYSRNKSYWNLFHKWLIIKGNKLHKTKPLKNIVSIYRFFLR